MPDPIPFVDRRKQVDDLWTTTDANLPPRASERHVPAVEYQHDENGEHLLPAAEAAASVVWNSGTSSYTYAWSRNLVGLPIRRGAGLVEIELVHPMQTRDHWMACAYPQNSDPLGAEEWADFAKTQSKTQVRIYNTAQLPQDTSFLLLVYGVRL